MAASWLTKVEGCSLQLDGPAVFQYYWWLKIGRLTLMHWKHMGSMHLSICKSKTHKLFLHTIPYTIPTTTSSPRTRPLFRHNQNDRSATLKRLDCSGRGIKKQEQEQENRHYATVHNKQAWSSLNTYYFCTNTTYRTDPTPRRHPTFLSPMTRHMLPWAPGLLVHLALSYAFHALPVVATQTQDMHHVEP